MTATFVKVLVSAAPITRLYRIGDEEFVAVESADPNDLGFAEGAIREALTAMSGDLMSTVKVLRPTVIVSCNEEGIPLSLTPLHTFPPGTSHEDALIQAGYEIGE